ncbi:MAG: Zinc import ATP-binding protein ZnuC [Candidatus Thorarchaeota archaeon]|nr:MAG: Zinc import ATP-binding protein ZnuC [Candidatus Thorarchaeota archaeon]
MSKSNLLFDVQDLAVKYPNGDFALHHVNFTVESPSFMAIIGPNGSGKSTLLKTALGLIRPTRGTIKMMGYDSVRDGHKIQRMVRYVPQRDQIGLNIPMKVKDIALMGRLLKKRPPRFASSKDKEITRQALEKVDMQDFWDRPFPELSGGQRQRVLVARALAGKGSILILDEPLAGTDAESQRLIVDALEDYHKNNDVSIVMVTHDLNPIHRMVKNVLLLKRTVIGIGAPCSIMDVDLLTKVYGPTARIVEYAGHRYCVTHDSGMDRHE